MKQPLTARVQRARDIRLIVCMAAVSILSFCGHNRWHRTLHESGGEQGEPSAFALVTSKIAGWALFILMQAYAHLPTILSLLLWL